MQGCGIQPQTPPATHRPAGWSHRVFGGARCPPPGPHRGALAAPGRPRMRAADQHLRVILSARRQDRHGDARDGRCLRSISANGKISGTSFGLASTSSGTPSNLLRASVRATSSRCGRSRCARNCNARKRAGAPRLNRDIRKCGNSMHSWTVPVRIWRNGGSDALSARIVDNVD
jgi:hypothetical protein